MIKTIRIKHVKGTTTNQELTGRDIFIGRNGAGKSTRLQAVALATLGYIPGKGKTNQETFKLSTGEEMTAGLQMEAFSFDRSIIRAEKLKGDGSKDIKYSESLTISPNKGEKNATEMKSRVTNEIGNFPIVFDFQQFLDMSDAKRREFIYGLSPISTDAWDKPKVTEHLEKKLLAVGLKTTNHDLYEATQELINNSLNEWPNGYDLSAGLQAMLSWVEHQQKAWNKKEKDAIGAVRELADMKNQLEQTDRDIVAHKEELKDLRQQFTNVHGQIQAGREIRRQWEQKKSRMEQLNVEVQRLADELAQPNEADYEGKITDLQARIKQTDIAAESESIQKEIITLRNKNDEKQNEYNKLESQINRLSTELHTMNTVLKNIQEKGAGICVIHPQIACDKDFSKFTDHVGVNGPRLQTQIDELIRQREEMKEEIGSIHSQSDALESKKRALYQSVNEETKTNDRIMTEIDSIRKSEQAARTTKQTTENKKVMLQDELDRLQNEAMPTFAPLEILEPHHAALSNQIVELERKIEEQEKARITHSNAMTAMISSSKAQYYHTAAKNLSEALGAKGIQGELVKGILGPIEEAINENLRLMGVEYPVFFSTESETGKEVFQFGWIKGGRSTNFDVLSTGEQLIFLSAFLVTLLERANPPLKVLALDNIENLDEINLQNALKGLDALAHKLDNILIAGVIKPNDLKNVGGWHIWNLSPETEAVVSA